jgi:arginine utilization protein RocB
MPSEKPERPRDDLDQGEVLFGRGCAHQVVVALDF